MKVKQGERKWCVGGNKLRRYVELGQILGNPRVPGKTTFLYSNDKKHVCQSTKLLKEALTNEYKHLFENFTHAHWVL